MSDAPHRPLIPAAVSRQQVNEALKPLYDLLNITQNHVYVAPALQFGSDSITFVVPAPETREAWDQDRPPGRPALRVVGSDTYPELAQVVVVEVIG